MSAYLDINITNTGASTLNWNGLGVKPIVNGKGTALTVGKLPANSIIGVRYNASAGNFQLLGEGGEYGTATPSDVRNTKTLGTENGVIQGALDLSNAKPENIKKGVVIDGKIGILEPLTIVAGDTIIKSEPGTFTEYTSMIKVKEFKILKSGTYRIKFDLYNYSGGNTTYGQIYKNGIAVGELRTTANTSRTKFVEDHTCNKNDLIQIYIKTSNAASAAVIDNIEFCIDLADRGVSIDSIADIVGHTDINTTRIYTRKTKKELLDIINKM